MINSGMLKVATPTDREIVMTRDFDAPCALVWRTMVEPELLKRWLSGPPGWTMTHCESDPRPGGTFRHVWRSNDGAEMAMRGVYREIVPPGEGKDGGGVTARIVRTEIFEFGCDAQAGEQLGTLVLTQPPRSSRTSLVLTLLYPSKEARDATIASGMEHGVSASYNRLDELLAAVPAS